MELIKLSEEQIKKIYNERMVNDFPEKELKPLKMILKSLHDGIYECFGLMDGETAAAYAFIMRHENNYLFDYIAVAKERRNRGIGSELLSAVREHFISADSVILEVEDPSFAVNEKEAEIQTRRLNFYLRNGYTDTGLRTELFDVNYMILETVNGDKHDLSTIAELYKAHYSAILNSGAYKSRFRIKNEL